MPYAAINVEGGLFPADLLDDIAAGTAGLPAASALGVDGRRLTDDIQAAFSDARSYWDAFQRRLDRSSESRVSLTRQDWMLKFLELIGFGSLSFQRAALEAGGQSYFIPHRAGIPENAPPVHIVGIDQELDRREGRSSPHALVQEYLNRSDALWGLVGNGNVLRLLRDTARLFKPTYLEFNLEGMMEGNQYSEFALLYRLIHSSHFPQPETNAQDCGLEKYYQDGLDQGGRVREHLRVGVEECLKGLGTAFLKHPESETLRQKLSDGRLDTAAYYRQLLRLVYRFLFLMVAEERRLIFPEEAAASPEQKVYRENYSIGKLRDRAERYYRGDTHSDLWLGLRETFRLFRNSSNAAKLGLTALDGELFGPSGCPDLEQAHCRNEELLNAIRHLSTFLDEGGTGRGRRARGPSVRRRVNYAGLNVEELGSVYESLLDFRPQVSLETQTFEFVSGSERKQTGSYYTPPELVRELINSALVPVIDDRLKDLNSQKEKETALLGLRVCDPASGSGHFLLAAARRIARELAQVRTGEQEPVPTEYRLALRDVIRNCVYAVDKNPLAVDLCKVALWIEGHNAGLPLSFLDHHIRQGDSLVGVFDLKVLEQGIPDDAYQPVTGDDKATAKAYLQRNKRERTGQLPLSAAVDTPSTMAEDFGALAELEERTPEDVQGKESLYASIREEGSGWWDLKVACDLWTAAFFLPMVQDNNALLERIPTTGSVRRYVAQPASASGQMVGTVIEASLKQNFFHWPLEFPEVFENGGFDVVIGNPPWDKVEMNEVEFFEHRDADIARLTGTNRKSAIQGLKDTDQVLWSEFLDFSRKADAFAKFAKTSGRFSMTGTGRMNTFALFAEDNTHLCSPNGRIGMLVPTSIATDHTFRIFFGNLVSGNSIVSLYDFENREGIFESVHRSYKFCLFTLSGIQRPIEIARFAFFRECRRDSTRRPLLHLVSGGLCLNQPQYTYVPCIPILYRCSYCKVNLPRNSRINPA